MRRILTLSSLTGIFIGTSVIPCPAWAVFFCYVPLWLVWVSAKSLKQIFISGWIAQFVFTLIVFNWVMHTVHEYGHLPWWIAFIALMGFCSFASLNVPIAGMIWFWLFRKSPRWIQMSGLVTVMALCEHFYPMIFNWNMGNVWLVAGFPAYQFADVIGIFGLSVFNLIINALVFYGYTNWRAGKPFLQPLAAGLAIFAVLNLLGVWRLHSLPTPDRVAKVLIIQANISNNDKEYAMHGGGTKDFVVRKFFDETAKALEETKTPIDFAVWPETAFPDILADPNLSFGYPARLREFVVAHNLNLITGSYGQIGRQLTNALSPIDKSGHLTGPPYAKTDLLAFGEYLPGAEWFPKLKQMIPEIADFARGGGPQILNLAGIRLGASICYEGIVEGFSAGLARKGAQILVNSTNDSWYPDWNEPLQHLAITEGRTIETRLPLVRATNTGISTVMLANGQTLESSPRGVEWHHLYEVPFLENPPPTPYILWGYFLIPLLLAVSLVILIVRRHHV